MQKQGFIQDTTVEKTLGQGVQATIRNWVEFSYDMGVGLGKSPPQWNVADDEFLVEGGRWVEVVEVEDAVRTGNKRLYSPEFLFHSQNTNVRTGVI